MARVEIWTNTRRAARGLTRLLAEGPPRLLPRIRVVTELADDPALPVDLPAAVPALRRKLELARLVAGLAAAEPELAAGTAVFDLADSLAELLDEMQGEGVSPEGFAKLDVAEHAAHWQRSLRFLTLITGYLAAAGPGDGQGRLRAAAEALAAAWAERPPGHPVIVAGSTGSRGATRAFMAAVARLPQGALVLPGFDADPAAGGLGPPRRRRRGRRRPPAARLPPARRRPRLRPGRRSRSGTRPRRRSLPATRSSRWRCAPPRSPTSGGARARRSPAPSTPPAPASPGSRRPTRAARRWRSRSGCGRRRRRGERAALVTPDRGLARRVTAELDRWAIIPDDSAGRPLSLTPPGRAPPPPRRAARRAR